MPTERHVDWLARLVRGLLGQGVSELADRRADDHVWGPLVVGIARIAEQTGGPAEVDAHPVGPTGPTGRHEGTLADRKPTGGNREGDTHRITELLVRVGG